MSQSWSFGGVERLGLFPLENHFQLEIFQLEKCFHLKIFSPENCFHLKIVSIEKLFTLENHFYVKIVSTWKLFPLENYSNFGSESHIWRVWIWTAPHLSAAKNIWFQPIKTNSSAHFKYLKGTILSVASWRFSPALGFFLHWSHLLDLRSPWVTQ